MAKIIQQREKCIGCNSCVEHAPSFWEMAEDGKSTLKEAINKKGFFIREIGEESIQENKLAAKDCPVNIIKIVE